MSQSSGCAPKAMMLSGVAGGVVCARNARELEIAPRAIRTARQERERTVRMSSSLSGDRGFYSRIRLGGRGMDYTLRMRMHSRLATAAAGVVVALTGVIAARQLPAGFNYDESKVPAYTLPDALKLANGQPVKDAETWKNKRRPELVALYEDNMYGHSAPVPKGVRYVVRDNTPGALGGLATRKQIGILLTGKEDGPRIELLLYIPAKHTGKVPAFLGLNFT